jgi:hypothetical protein
LLCQRWGGSFIEASRQLDAFYAAVRARLPDDQPIGGSSWKFWEQQFEAACPAAVAPSRGVTAGNRAAVDTYMRWYDQQQKEAR